MRQIVTFDDGSSDLDWQRNKLEQKLSILIAVGPQEDADRVCAAVCATYPASDIQYVTQADDAATAIESAVYEYVFIDESLWNDLSQIVKNQLSDSRHAAVTIVLTGDSFSLTDREADDLPAVEFIPRNEVSATVFRFLSRDRIRNAEAERAADTVALRDLEVELQSCVAREGTFLRDVLSSVTGGKLTLCFTDEEMPAARKPFSDRIVVTPNGGIRELRQALVDACHSVSMATERIDDFETAGGEAAMNAVVHANRGAGQVMTDESGETVQLWMWDQGCGISAACLPYATLRRGYSSVGTLGHGFKMILKTVDRVYLRTGSEGTTLLLEQDKIPTLVDSMWG